MALKFSPTDTNVAIQMAMEQMLISFMRIPEEQFMDGITEILLTLAAILPADRLENLAQREEVIRSAGNMSVEEADALLRELKSVIPGAET